LIVGPNDFPTGTRCSIKINTSGSVYYERYYYMDLASNYQYTLDAYLPEQNKSELKAINIVGQQEPYNSNPPVEDALIYVSKYINDSVGFETVSIMYSDANGQTFIYLENNVLYKINISKSSFNTEISDIITTSEIDSYTFRIFGTGYTGPTYTSFFDTVQFSFSMNGEYMQLGNVSVNFVDSNNSVIDIQIRIYEFYAGTTTLVNISNYTSSSFNYQVGGINTSRMHYVQVYFNSTSNYLDASPFDWIIDLIWNYVGSRDRFDERFSFDDRVKDVFGPMMIHEEIIGWDVVISVFIAIGILVLLGPYDTGVAIIGAGLGLALTNGIFSMWFTEDVEPALLALIPILIIIGILYLWTKGRGSDNL